MTCTAGCTVQARRYNMNYLTKWTIIIFFRTFHASDIIFAVFSNPWAEASMITALAQDLSQLIAVFCLLFCAVSWGTRISSWFHLDQLCKKIKAKSVVTQDLKQDGPKRKRETGKFSRSIPFYVLNQREKKRTTFSMDDKLGKDTFGENSIFDLRRPLQMIFCK